MAKNTINVLSKGGQNYVKHKHEQKGYKDDSEGKNVDC